MMVSALLSWWYTTGWKQMARRVTKRVGTVLDAFSVGILAQTLFDPYRQISSEQVRGGLDVQFKAWSDRTFSRVFGAFMRSMFILVGGAGAFAIGMIGWLEIALWPLVPLLPLVGLALLLTGWTP